MTEARCDCGAVVLEVADDPAEINNCQCSWCQRLGALWAYIPRTKCASSPGGTRPPDVRHRREGRVHRHDGRHRGGIEVIVDLGGVEACDGDGRKEGGEQRRPSLGQLVQDERAADDLGQDGEKAGSGRRLQHAGRRPDGGCGQGSEAERGRRGELLEGLALGGAAGVGGEKAGDLGQGGKPGSRSVGFAEQRLSVFAEE